MGRLRLLPLPAAAAVLLLLALSVSVTCVAGKDESCGELDTNPSISHVAVLLPPKTSVAVKMRLHGHNGCFDWKTPNYDFVEVKPEFNETAGCSTSALITSVAPYTGRRSGVILATETVSGKVLRCAVYVDAMASIRVQHHTLTLDVGGLAELYVRAYDAMDNVFSALQGLPMKWTLQPMADAGGDVLEHVPLHEVLLCSPLRVHLEDKGVGADVYVVKGVSSGRSTVSVRVEETAGTGGRGVLEDSVELTVAQPMYLSPIVQAPLSRLCIPPGATLAYNLHVVHNDDTTVVSMPSGHYKWSVSDPSVASIDEAMGEVRARRGGSAEVTVEDVRVPGHKATAVLHVCVPHALEVNVAVAGEAPAGATVVELITGGDYEVVATALDAQGHPILLTKDATIKLQVDNRPVWHAVGAKRLSRALEDSDLGQGVAQQVHADAEGSGSFTASLTYYTWELDIEEYKNKKTETIRGSVRARVCSPVHVELAPGLHETDEPLRLPWAEGVQQDYKLNAAGGCGGPYKWSVADESVATISADGRVVALQPGRTKIHIEDARNSANANEIELEVSEPTVMEVPENLAVEAGIGDFLLAAVFLKDSQGRTYHNCTAFAPAISWDVDHEEVLSKFEEDSPKQLHKTAQLADPAASGITASLKAGTGEACAAAYFVSESPGVATVSADLDLGKLEPVRAKVLLGKVPVHLKTNWEVHVFSPLTVLNKRPSYGHGGLRTVPSITSELLLAPGATATLLLQGGPEKWRTGHDVADDAHVASYEAEEPAVAVERGTASKELIVTCLGVGTATVTFHRRVVPITGYHERPASATAAVKVTCAVPNRLLLVAHDSEESVDAVPQEDAPVSVTLGREVVAVVIAQDSALNGGRLFDNATSLACDLNTGHAKVIAVEAPWERRLRPCDEPAPGAVELAAHVTGIKKEAKSARATPAAWAAAQAQVAEHVGMLQHKLKVNCVEPLSLQPASLLLYYDSNATTPLSVLGGTGRFHAESSDPSVVEVIQGNGVVLLRPKSAGHAEVVVRDDGVTGPTSTATARVRVADVSAVRVLLPSTSVSVPRGGRLLIPVQAIDDQGEPFPESQVAAMKPDIHVSDAVLVPCKASEDEELLHLESHVLCLEAAEEGTADFYVAVHKSDRSTVKSDLVHVTAFPPLTLHPAELKLAPGASRGVTAHGGPPSGATVRYWSDDPSIATVESLTGRVTGVALGDTKIYAICEGSNGETYGTAHVSTHVTPVKGFKLDLNGGTLAVNRSVAVFPTGLSEGEDLLFFGPVCTNYQWSVNHPEVLSIEPLGTMPSEHGLSALGEIDDGFEARMTGLSPGKATVTLKASCNTQGLKPQTIKASGTVLVVADLPLALGDCATWVLPKGITTRPLPHEMGAGRNADKGAHVTYSIMEDQGAADPKQVYKVAQLGEGDRIQTGDEQGVACVRAYEAATQRERVAVCVRVADIARLRLSDKDESPHSAELSLGSDATFHLELQDEVGEDFVPLRAGEVTLYVENNAPDVAEVTGPAIDETVHASERKPLALTVRALRQGSALIRVQLASNPQVANYIAVRVGEYVTPRKPVVHLGGKVRFAASGAAPTAEGHNVWYTADPKVLRINPVSGEAVALSTGTTTVHYNGTHLKTYTSATVATIATAEVTPLDGLRVLTNVPEPGASVRRQLFTLRFKDAHNNTISDDAGNNDNRVEQRIAFVCRLSPPELGSAVTYTDAYTGQHYCIVELHSPATLAASALQLGADVVEAKSVVVKAEAFGGIEGVKKYSVEGRTTMPFAPGFEIEPAAPPELVLSSIANDTILTIYGDTDAVQPVWHHHDALQVRRISEDTGRSMFVVKLLQKDKPFSDVVTFTNPATGQRQELRVQLPSGSVLPKLAKLALGALTVLACVLASLLCMARARGGAAPRRPKPSHRTTEPPAGAPPAGATPSPAAPPVPISPVPLLPGQSPTPFRSYRDDSGDVVTPTGYRNGSPYTTPAVQQRRSPSHWGEPTLTR
eukprot:jgi/Chlat1/967/Chrsp108S08619